MGKGHYGGSSSERLKQFIERIERLEDEKKNITCDINEIFSEAKGTGFDAKIMRQIIKLRKLEQTELDEQEHLLDMYKRALGMLPDLFDEDDNPAIRENPELDVKIKKFTKRAKEHGISFDIAEKAAKADKKVA